MFNRLQTYAVYVKGDDAVFLREGFNAWALVFNLFWALYYRLWHVAGAVFLFYVATSLLVVRDVLPEMGSNLLNIAIGLWLGFDAADLRGKSLVKKGYRLHDIVRGADEEDAALCFLEGVRT